MAKSGTELAHAAQAHREAGRHEQAALHYMAAAQQFRSTGSHAAADSMDKEAKASAKANKKSENRPYAEKLRTWAKSETKSGGGGADDIKRDEQGRFA